MHRQSLGSPAFKLHSHGVIFAGDGAIKADIDSNSISDDLQSHRKDKSPSSSAGAPDDEQRKSPKPYQQRHVLVSSSTRLVHLIPLLTFLCFLILYLSSHDPSRKDLAQFTGFTTISSKKTFIDSIDLDDNAGGGFLKIDTNDALAIRSMRNLQQQQQQQQQQQHRLHRKLGQ